MNQYLIYFTKKIIENQKIRRRGKNYCNIYVIFDQEK